MSLSKKGQAHFFISRHRFSTHFTCMTFLYINGSLFTVNSRAFYIRVLLDFTHTLYSIDIGCEEKRNVKRNHLGGYLL